MKTITELRKMSMTELKYYLMQMDKRKYYMFGKTCNNKGMLLQLITSCKYTG